MLIIRIILVKREKHCLTPPAANSSDIIIQIHGQTIDVDDSRKKELYYLEGTTATYSLRETRKPHATDNQQYYWRCMKKRTRNETTYYAWEMTTEPLFIDRKDLHVCSYINDYK